MRHDETTLGQGILEDGRRTTLKSQWTSLLVTELHAPGVGLTQEKLEEAGSLLNRPSASPPPPLHLPPHPPHPPPPR